EGAAAPAAAPKASSGAGTAVNAPLPGTIVKVIAEAGTEVAADETIMIIEAMKMETEIKSPVAGVVASVDVSAGTVVAAGDVLATIEEK
ncbi:MAG: biotin/lipoyl-binding protein, partial [Lentisphaeria bacterium]|nr:biotin/lipoyl-binding protein [Lentisphaeria bacterium]